MKKILFFTALLFISKAGFSQDFISLKKGTKLEAIITEITPTMVRYKLYSDPKGKTYFAYKEDIAGILYQNGGVESFGASNEQKSGNSSSSSSIKNRKKSGTSSSPKTNSHIREEGMLRPGYLESIQENLETNPSSVNSSQRDSMDDVILFKDGTRKTATILEVTPNAVKYWGYDIPNGVLYTTNKSDIAKVIYKNGREETFTSSFETASSGWSDNSNLYLGGNEDIIYLKNGSIIRGTIVEQIPNKSIRIETAEGNILAYQMNDIGKIGKAGKETPRKNYRSTQSSGLKPGYKGIIDVGYYFGVGNVKLDRLNLNIINGYQLNPYISLGIGTGVHYYIDDQSILIPFFADFRANFINGAVSPYLSFDIGYSFNAKDNFRGAGIMLNPTLGVSYKFADGGEMHAGFGYQRQSVQFHSVVDLFDYYPRADYGSLAIKIGFSF
ncbi:MAG: hypothetical protein FWF52_05070 [Candidatus Azobacteroides sp.]|nr:hypothetical protein [Candidatus Azobacteroides sp.]